MGGLSVEASCRAGFGLVALAVAGLLTACAIPPSPPPDDAVPIVVPAVIVPSDVTLQPLARQLTVPAGAPPRSTVAAVNYELTVPGAGVWLPEGGLPGDEASRDVFEQGGASWYGFQFHQRKTANGERFDMTAMTAAHKTLPFGTHVCVKSLANGREVMVRINDRGPYAAGRIIDLSRAAADAIDMVSLGIKQVSLTTMSLGERCGESVDEEREPPVVAATRVKRSVRSRTKAKVRRTASPSALKQPAQAARPD